MKPKNTGIMKAIMRRCAGSMPGEGVMDCVRNMVTMIRMGRICVRVGLRQIGQPEPMGLAQLDGVTQHGIVGEEQRHLDSIGRQLPYMFTLSAL